tara:strand:- start:2908 stop:3114 length:207 start_codon:yes stop_codon:yes gene_type:complete
MQYCTGDLIQVLETEFCYILSEQFGTVQIPNIEIFGSIGIINEIINNEYELLINNELIYVVSPNLRRL